MGYADASAMGAAIIKPSGIQGVTLAEDSGKLYMRVSVLDSSPIWVVGKVGASGIGTGIIPSKIMNNASGDNSIVIGMGSQANNANSIAIGTNLVISKDYSVLIGDNNESYLSLTQKGKFELHGKEPQLVLPNYDPKPTSGVPGSMVWDTNDQSVQVWNDKAGATKTGAWDEISTKQYVDQQINKKMDDMFPIGTYLIWFGTTPPNGWSIVKAGIPTADLAKLNINPPSGSINACIIKRDS
jgi:hypothetical protein